MLEQLKKEVYEANMETSEKRTCHLHLGKCKRN